LSCDPQESEYVDIDKKIIYLCENFAYKIWNGDDQLYKLNEKTARFDNCGLKKDFVLEKITKDEVIIPSKVIV